jgi:hypothetical protein
MLRRKKNSFTKTKSTAGRRGDISVAVVTQVGSDTSLTTHTETKRCVLRASDSVSNTDKLSKSVGGMNAAERDASLTTEPLSTRRSHHLPFMVVMSEQFTGDVHSLLLSACPELAVTQCCVPFCCWVIWLCISRPFCCTSIN